MALFHYSHGYSLRIIRQEFILCLICQDSRLISQDCTLCLIRQNYISHLIRQDYILRLICHYILRLIRQEYILRLVSWYKKGEHVKHVSSAFHGHNVNNVTLKYHLHSVSGLSSPVMASRRARVEALLGTPHVIDRTHHVANHPPQCQLVQGGPVVMVSGASSQFLFFCTIFFFVFFCINVL